MISVVRLSSCGLCRRSIMRLASASAHQRRTGIARGVEPLLSLVRRCGPRECRALARCGILRERILSDRPRVTPRRLRMSGRTHARLVVIVTFIENIGVVIAPFTTTWGTWWATEFGATIILTHGASRCLCAMDSAGESEHDFGCSR